MIPIWKDVIYSYDWARSFTYDMPSKYSGTIPAVVTPHTYTGASMVDTISCNVTEELQGDYLLNLTYPTEAILSDKIAVNTFIVAQVDELQKDGLQLFRIRKVTTDGISGTITVEATHISYDTNGVVYRIFDDHYGEVTPSFAANDDGHTHKMRSIGSMYNYFPFYSDFNYSASNFYGFGNNGLPTTARAMIGENENSYIKLVNLEPQYDNGTTYLLVRRGTDRNVTLRYGRDITAISQSVDASDCIAFIGGYYRKENRGTYTNSAHYPDHNTWDAYCPSKVIDFTSEIEDSVSTSDIPAKILELINKEIAANPDADKPKVQIDVSFERSDVANTYASILEAQQIRLGDSVKVYYPPMNVNTTVRVVKTDYDVLLNRYNSISLGSIQTTLASGAGKTTAKIFKNSK